MSAPSNAPGSSTIEGSSHRTMGEYLLLERIASGGMGEVWLGKRKGDDGSYGELRAVKFLHAEHAESPEVVAMFVEEARLAARLDHPGVSRLFELGRDESTYYIAMEHVFGRDLLTVLRRARDRQQMLPPAVVAWIGQKLAEALDAAHHAFDDDGQPLSIVHRDVSPQNVILAFDGRVKLIDFGIARTQSALRAKRPAGHEGRIVRGKLGYVSPEQAQGKTVDHKSDQFSLGICLWEMLVLRPLFRRKSDSATLDDVIRARVPPLRSKVPACPHELAAIVERMLQKDPEARFPEAGDVAAALSSFLSRQSQRPERADVASLVRKLFDEDYARDRMRLDALELVGQADRKSGPVETDATPPRGLPAVIAQSIASSSLFDDDDPHEQATAIFPDAGPLAQRIEREVLFRRESVPSRASDSGSRTSRGPVHATFRPGRAAAAEIWRPPATDLADSVSAFEAPELAEERERASFEEVGAFTGARSSPPPEGPPPKSARVSSRPPPALAELPTRSELSRRAADDVDIDVSMLRPAPVPRELSGEAAARRDPSRPVTVVTQKVASIPPPPDAAQDASRARDVAATRPRRWGLVLALVALSIALIGAALYASSIGLLPPLPPLPHR